MGDAPCGRVGHATIAQRHQPRRRADAGRTGQAHREGSNMAVETTRVAPETENVAVRDYDAPASEEEATARIGGFA